MVSGERGQLCSIDADGSVQWVLQMPEGVAAIHLGPNDVIYGSGASGLHAVQPGGRILWRQESVTAQAFFANGAGEVFAESSGFLCACGPTGKILWSIWLDAPPAQSSLGRRSRLYVGVRGVTVISRQGTPDWSFRPSPEWDSGPVALDPQDGVFVCLLNDDAAVSRLWRLDDGGGIQWSVDVPFSPMAMAAGVDGRAYVLNMEGIAAFDAAGSQEWWLEQALVSVYPQIEAGEGLVYAFVEVTGAVPEFRAGTSAEGRIVLAALK